MNDGSNRRPTPERRLPLHRLAASAFVLLALAGFSRTAPPVPASPAPAVEDDKATDDLRPVEVRRPKEMQRATLAFRLVLDEPIPGSQKLAEPETGQLLILSPKALVTESDILKTEVGWDGLYPSMDYYMINVYFKPDAAQRLQEFSRAHLGDRLAIVIDGHILIAPRLNGPFSSEIMLQGQFTREAATRLAEQLAPQ
jgi:preprotein translocase subunit SecD